MPERVIVFDVNETLWDLAGLDPLSTHVFGAARARAEWFEQVLNLALTSALVGTFDDFTSLGNAALAMVAAKRGMSLKEEHIARIAAHIVHLPAHPDAHAALERLQRADFRLTVLTNSTAAVVETQLDHAGLTPFFDVILSVDAVKRFKPALEPYRFAASRVGMPTSRLRMVAVHNWHITGAMAAGCKAAFVARGRHIQSAGSTTGRHRTHAGSRCRSNR